MMDVMFYEVFQEEDRALKLFLPKDVRAGFTNKTIQGSGEDLPPTSFISIRTQSLIPHGWADKLEGVLTRSTGHNHISEYCQATSSPLLAGYLPYYCSRSVAEHAFLAVLTLLRKLKRQVQQFDSFDRDGLTGLECFEKNLLVIGVGSIGSQVVDIGRGFKMNVSGVDIEERLEDLEYLSLSEGVAWAEVIICALPLTDQTKGLLNYAVLKRARKGLILVNISRGEITPIADQKRLFLEETLGGLSLDVYEEESGLSDYLRGEPQEATGRIKDLLELRNRNNVLLTPHNAFNTQEALERKAEQSIEAVTLFLEKKTFPYPVPGIGEVIV